MIEENEEDEEEEEEDLFLLCFDLKKKKVLGFEIHRRRWRKNKKNSGVMEEEGEKSVGLGDYLGKEELFLFTIFRIIFNFWMKV